MRLKTLLAVLSSFLVVSCAGMPNLPNIPPRPNVYACLVDIVGQQLICAPTGNMTSVDETAYEQIKDHIIRHPDHVRIPLKQAHKFIAFHPKHWEATSVYMKTIRDELGRVCK